MTKFQKALVLIFLAMAIIPEVLWSPVYKFWYSIKSPTVGGNYAIVRENFLDKEGNSDLWSNLILFQFFGLFFVAVYLVIVRKSFKNPWIAWLLAGIFLLMSLYVFWLQGLSTITIRIL